MWTLPCAHLVSEPAPRGVRKPVETWGTQASPLSLSHSNRSLHSGFLARGTEPTGFLSLVWIVLETSLLTKQLWWCLGETDSNSGGCVDGQG